MIGPVEVIAQVAVGESVRRQADPVRIGSGKNFSVVAGNDDNSLDLGRIPPHPLDHVLHLELVRRQHRRVVQGAGEQLAPTQELLLSVSVEGNLTASIVTPCSAAV